MRKAAKLTERSDDKMKKTWKTILAAGCALSMLFTMPGSAVLAEELQEDAVIVSEAAQVHPEGADFETEAAEINADIADNASDSETYDETDKKLDAAIEEAPEIDVSIPQAETDGVTAPYDEIETEDGSSFEGEEIVGAGDDYPANLKNAALDAIVDPWNFYNRECTSFAAWCLNSRNGVKFTNQYLGASRWGNANTWGTVAKSLGVTVNMTPAVGAIAWWTTGKYGHVAWVSAVNGSSVFIEEYNYKVRGGYGTRTIAASDPAGYIHIKDITPSGKPMTSGYDAVLPDGDYQILCAANTDYYLDIDGSGSEPNGANVKLYNPASDSLPSYDIWTISYSNGFYKIKQKGGNLCLDVSGGSALRGTNVQAWPDNGQSPQKWAISKFSNGVGYRLQSGCSGYSLDVENGTMARNTNVRQWEGNDSNAQRWLFIPYEPAKTVANGRYILVSAINPNIVMDVSGDSSNVNDGTNVQVWSDTSSSKYNSFDVKYLDHGYYSLIQHASGKSLEVKDSSVTNNANIQISTSTGAMNQRWAIMKLGSGYMLVSRKSGLVADVYNGLIDNGTNIQQHYYNGSNAQTWKFVKAEYKVKYDANGGSGAPSAQTKYYKNALKLSTKIPTRTGFKFLGWSTSKTATSAAYNAGSSYTKDKAVTLYAVWAGDFSDVQDPSHPFYDAIYWAADAGITKGYSDGTFGINKDCTRGEMIMFLWRYVGQPAPKAVSKSPFPDVAVNHAFYNAILWASQKGITKGYPDGTFGINRNVSRGECMMFLWRLKGKPAPTAVSVTPFKDVPKSHAFYNAILWGYQKKITNGYTSGDKKGTFGINENCTRGAIVTFLYRAK